MCFHWLLEGDHLSLFLFNRDPLSKLPHSEKAMHFNGLIENFIGKYLIPMLL